MSANVEFFRRPSKAACTLVRWSLPGVPQAALSHTQNQVRDPKRGCDCNHQTGWGGMGGIKTLLGI